MPLDSQAQALVDMMASSGAPPFWEGDHQAARVQMAALANLLRPGPPLDRVENIEIGIGPEALAARLYSPSDPNGLIIYFHGGGWVFGNLDEFDPMCRELAARSGAAIVSLDYRLAPEHPFPAAVNDAMAAIQWALDGRLPLQKASPLIVAGDSAGGNLAAVVAHAFAPHLAGQILIYPVLQPDLNTPSYVDFADGPTIGRAAMEWFWQQYIADPADRRDLRASPLLAPNHTAAPPALIITAEYDPLRWEGETYAERLRSEGVIVHAKRFDGLPHGFFTLVGLVDRSIEAIDLAAYWLRNLVK